MSYSITFHQISGLVASGHSSDSLAAAKRVAVDAVESGAARHAEIRDRDGTLLLEYPDDEKRLSL